MRTMSRNPAAPARMALWACLIGLSLGLSACAISRDPPPRLPDTGGSPTAAHAQNARLQGDVGELAAALALGGAEVRDGGPIQQSFIPIPGELLRVNDADLQVFPFATEADRQNFSRAIASDGLTIGELHPAWPAQPFFWASHNLLVLYIGGDPTTIRIVSQLLGDPLAPLVAVN
jgi:hypothetical protein